MRRLLAGWITLTTLSVGFADERASMAPLAAEDWDASAAAHLLRRAGFGGTPAEVDRLAALSPSEAVSFLIDYDEIPYAIAPPAVPGELYEPEDRRSLRNLSEQERRQKRDERRKMERRAFEETRLWWIDRLAHSPRPFEEKMTLFWHGHFTSGMREVRDAIKMKEQNEFLRRHALDHFGELLLGVSRDPAMLVYLDGARNNKRQPNENYARELLELFSLGEGAYTESDIKAAARAFTGWGYDERGFVFRKALHDYDQKRFLGRSGRLNGDDVIEIILQQPACARYLAERLLKFFVTPAPDRALVESLAAVIRRERYELKPVMRTLLESRAFYHADHRGALVKSPVEVLIGTSRQFGKSIHDLRAAERAMAGMGQELLQPPNVRGWPGGATWINTATLFNRYNVVSAMLAPAPRGRAVDKSEWNDEEMFERSMAEMSMRSMDMEEKSRVSQRGYVAFDPLAVVESYELKTAREIVDFFATRVLATPLSEQKAELLADYLRADGKEFRPKMRKADERLLTMLQLMCSTPEYQMN